MTLSVVHIVLSFVALASGLTVVAGLLAARSLDNLTALYFASSAAADVTGFALSTHFGIAHYIGLISVVALLVAIVARYVFRLAGIWRPTYAAATVVSVHVLVFFTIGEGFLRIPALNALAPTLTERPFAVAQIAVFLLFVGFAIAAAVRFKPDRAAAR
jgi:membrane-bound metal-dependent hydrolase YbcI (DUF457 family)